MLLQNLCRGEDFRLEYLYLSEPCSLIPTSVNIMALTATASDALISEIIKDTGMINPSIVQVSPDKSFTMKFRKLHQWN